jgi:hypothetical protein
MKKSKSGTRPYYQGIFMLFIMKPSRIYGNLIFIYSVPRLAEGTELCYNLANQSGYGWKLAHNCIGSL